MRKLPDDSVKISTRYVCRSVCNRVQPTKITTLMLASSLGLFDPSKRFSNDVRRHFESVDSSFCFCQVYICITRVSPRLTTRMTNQYASPPPSPPHPRPPPPPQKKTQTKQNKNKTPQQQQKHIQETNQTKSNQNKQTKPKTDKHTNESTKERTNKQTSKQTNKQTNKEPRIDLNTHARTR